MPKTRSAQLKTELAKGPRGLVTSRITTHNEHHVANIITLIIGPASHGFRLSPLLYLNKNNNLLFNPHIFISDIITSGNLISNSILLNHLPHLTKTVKPHRLPSDLIPPYPYGERLVYKQSNAGLYGSARIRFGNTVAPKHNNKARRLWRPNVHVKTFLIPALGARIKTRLTLRVLKTIRREGGIENYLLKSKPARLKELGPGGWNLRWLLMQSRAVQQRFNDERVALGLEPRELEDRDDIIQYALDYATPGPLSLRSKATLAEMRAALDQTFVLGDEGLADLEGIQELSDEEEALLMQQIDRADEVARTSQIKAEKEKQSLEV